MLSTELVGAIGIPVTPPAERGATASACHCCWSAGKEVAALGRLAQATPLKRIPARPAVFHVALGQAGFVARPNERLRNGDLNTTPLIADQG
jgi:hypothetical protein